MRTIQLIACPVCAAETSEPIDAGDGHMLRECTACGTVFARAYADPKEVFTPGYLHGKAGAFGLDCSHPRMHDYLVRCGHRRLEIVEAETGVRGGSLLDVGCGTGELLEAAVARGWTVQGVDPLADAAEHVRDVLGLEVFHGTLEGSGLPEGSFDVVCAMHVLEHMPSATDFLATMARWARPGGFVAIESPNWDSVQRIVAGRHWMGLRPLEHLIHLGPESLRTAFTNAGLEPVAVRTPAHTDPVHTLDERLVALGRPHWHRRLQRLPAAPVRSFLRAIERRDERRGRGAALLGVARRPA